MIVRTKLPTNILNLGPNLPSGVLCLLLIKENLFLN